jgi:hypothetical protein
VFLAASLALPLFAAPRAGPETIAARQRFFGPENVDARGNLPKDKVIFSWLTNASFAASVAGRIVLLDTFVTRLEVVPGRVPFVIKDIVDLQPEAIFLGHGHFDHADNAAYIAAKTGATIYATEETCGAMRDDFARMQNDPVIQHDAVAAFPPNASVKCVNVTSFGSVPATQVVRLDALGPDACIIAFRHLHSIAVPPDPDFPPTPGRIIPDPRDAEFFPRGVGLTPSNPRQPGQMDLRTGGSNGPGGPASIFYHFVVRGGRHFTFAWHNTAGALKEGKGNGWDGVPADGQRIIDVMKSLPFTDVQMGTASTANYQNNGLRDLIMYTQALNPKVYIPNHLTTGTSTVESASMSVYAGYLKQLQLMGVSLSDWPDVRWLVDPTDYAHPIVFDIDDPGWENPAKGPRIAKWCGRDGDDDGR